MITGHNHVLQNHVKPAYRGVTRPMFSGSELASFTENTQLDSVEQLVLVDAGL